MSEYTYTSRTAGTLANGRPVGHGDTVKLSAEEAKDPHNAAMIESEVLVASDKSADEKKDKKES